MFPTGTTYLTSNGRPRGNSGFFDMFRNKQTVDRQQNDGDLAWNEFLATRAVFDRLDRDQDGLIDHAEAAADSAVP